MTLVSPAAHSSPNGRRRLLLAAMLGGLSACRGSEKLSAFSARFHVAGTGSVTFDFWDERNFALTPAAGFGATRVIDGRVYLVVFASLATAGRERVIWAGELKPSASTPDRISLALRPTAAAAELQQMWKINGPLRDVSLPAPSLNLASVDLTVARLAALAHAQYVIDTRMRSAMDMRLCGDSINRMVAAWPAQVTTQGWAVVASGAGVTLAGPLQALARAPALPAGVAVEDLRIAPAPRG